MYQKEGTGCEVDQGSDFFDTIKADLAERTAMASKVSQDIFWELVADKAADRTGWQRLVNWRR